MFDMTTAKSQMRTIDTVQPFFPTNSPFRALASSIVVLNKAVCASCCHMHRNRVLHTRNVQPKPCYKHWHAWVTKTQQMQTSPPLTYKTKHCSENNNRHQLSPWILLCHFHVLLLEYLLSQLLNAFVYLYFNSQHDSTHVTGLINLTQI